MPPSHTNERNWPKGLPAPDTLASQWSVLQTPAHAPAASLTNHADSKLVGFFNVILPTEKYCLSDGKGPNLEAAGGPLPLLLSVNEPQYHEIL